MILDSGERREFPTGAKRDMPEGKGRCDLMPLGVVDKLIHGGSELNFVNRFKETGEENYLVEAVRVLASNRYDNVETMLLEVSKHFENGAKKYGENNWQLGIPVKSYIDSAVRHYIKHSRGDKDEPHLEAVVWNLMCAIWTCEHKPELNEYRRVENESDAN